MAGGVLSTIVTMAVSIAALPLASVTFNVTVTGDPILEQLKDLILVSNTKLACAVQLSEEPLSTALSVIVAFPVPSNGTVMFLVTTVGLSLSSAVTIAVAVVVFPLASVTLSVTVTGDPILEQLKDLILVSYTRLA